MPVRDAAGDSREPLRDALGDRDGSFPARGNQVAHADIGIAGSVAGVLDFDPRAGESARQAAV